MVESLDDAVILLQTFPSFRFEVFCQLAMDFSVVVLKQLGLGLEGLVDAHET